MYFSQDALVFLLSTCSRARGFVHSKVIEGYKRWQLCFGTGVRRGVEMSSSGPRFVQPRLHIEEKRFEDDNGVFIVCLSVTWAYVFV